MWTVSKTRCNGAIWLGGFAAFLFQVQTARCGSASTTMSVTLTITSGCTVSTTPLNFGTAQALTSPLSASTTISPICTNSTPYNIGIDQGAGSGASVTTRVMTGTTVSDTVNYSLYKDAAHSIVWGNTIGTNTFPGTGTGASQSIPVYGLVSAQASVPDSYADVVNVTITY